MTSDFYTITFPPGFPLINVNGREHWAKRAKATAGIREMACLLARDIPAMGKVAIRAIYYPGDRRKKRDSPNVLYLSSKAAIDGIVDAKVIVDDCDEYVRSLSLFPGGHIVKGGQMVIEIEECRG